MFKFKKNKKGFTFTEILFVAIISVMVIGAILSVWLLTYSTWTGETERTHLRVDTMKALEMMKNDIRLSSLTFASFYPAGSGPYSAMSVPVAKTDPNGFYTLNANNEIDWNKTVIYHLYTDGDGNKTVRRTAFDPRDNTMDEDARDAQLTGVAKAGTGGEGSTTDTEFLQNVDTFEISSLSPIIDFYEDSSSAVKVGKIVFGSIKLDAGDHTFNFEITGQNDSSSGYDIGIDSMMINPSGSVRETEYYNSTFAPSGALTVSGGSVSRVHNSLWGNDNYLEYKPGGIGDSIEILDHYDLWRESEFLNASLNNVKRSGEEVYMEMDIPISDTPPEKDGEITWFSYAQAGDPQQGGGDGELLNLLNPASPPAYPVAIRTIVTKSYLDKEGDLIRVKFKSSSENPLKIDAAYITRRNNNEDGFENLDPAGLDIEEYHMHQRLFFFDEYDMDSDAKTDDMAGFVYVPANGEVWSKWTAFPLIIEDSTGNDVEYFITFCVSDPTGVSWPGGWSFDAVDTDCTYWEGSVVNSYYTTAGYVDVLQYAGTPEWNTLNVEESDDIFITANIDIWDNNSSIESQIFDTTLSAPEYNEIKWSKYGPAGTDILLKARSSASIYMTDASDWDTITGSSSNPHSLSIGNGRYVQFLAELSSDGYWEAPGATLSYADYIDTQVAGQPYDFPEDSGEPYITGVYSTWIDDVEIDWPGTSRICTITGYIARRDDYGQAKFTVDGEELIKILSIHVKTAKEVQGRTMGEENYIEVQPRNTGK